jgi:hypothetical protein
LWSANCHEPIRLVVEFSCFICPDHDEGERWFVALPTDLATNGRYTLSTRSAVVALVVEHKMSFEQAADLARKRFHLLNLDASTIQRWMRADVPDAHTLGSYEREVVARFSGQLAVDELYDDGLAIIKATDPLTGLEIGYEVVEGSVDRAVIIRFFRRLKAMGIEPEVVVTDGAKFYPDAIATVWPNARHQSCLFHFIKGWLTKAMKAFWSCWRTLPAPKKRGRGRPKKRGRPREDKRKRRHRDLVRRARYLVFKRPERLTDDEQTRLHQALEICPPLRELYRLVSALYAIFGPDVIDPDTARERRSKLLDDPDFRDNEAFATLLAALADDVLFQRLIVYLDYENASNRTKERAKPLTTSSARIGSTASASAPITAFVASSASWRSSTSCWSDPGKCPGLTRWDNNDSDRPRL